MACGSIRRSQPVRSSPYILYTHIVPKRCERVEVVNRRAANA